MSKSLGNVIDPLDVITGISLEVTLNGILMHITCTRILYFRPLALSFTLSPHAHWFPGAYILMKDLLSTFFCFQPAFIEAINLQQLGETAYSDRARPVL